MTTLGETLCVDVRGLNLFLAPLSGGAPSAKWSRPALLHVPLKSGIIEIRGILVRERAIEVNGLTQDALQFKTDPGRVRHINRRAHYRVSVLLKGEIAAFRPDEVPTDLAGQLATKEPEPGRLEELTAWLSERRRPCVVRDLSLGGALLSTASPPPSPGCHAFLDLALVAGDVLRNVPALVVECRARVHPAPLDAEARIRFEHLPPKAEARLSRELNRIQLELLKKGIRT